MVKHSPSGPSQRALRVGEQIRRIMSQLLTRGEVHDPDLNRMSITVGEVRVTSDLSIATAYVLPLGGSGVEDALTRLRANKGEIRRLIAREMKLKHTPDLRFAADETFDQMDRTRALLSQDAVRRDLEGE
jgi:ribosome-binding factor A